MKIIDYIKPGNVFFIDEIEKFKIIDFLSEKAFSLKLIKDLVKFKKAIRHRETVLSTGIGLGIAVPHVKLPDVNNFFVLVGILKNGTDWDSIDQKDVHIVFLIGGPDNNQSLYLQILSGLMVVVKNDEKRFKIQNAADVKNVFECFKM